MGHSLIIRKRLDGSRTVESDLPDEHTFSSRWIRKELGDLVSVRVIVHTTDGDVEYELTGFEPVLEADGTQAIDTVDGEPRSNWTGWETRRVQEPSDA